MLRFLVTTSYNILEALTKFRHFWSLYNIYIILNSSNSNTYGFIQKSKMFSKNVHHLWLLVATFSKDHEHF